MEEIGKIWETEFGEAMYRKEMNDGKVEIGLFPEKEMRGIRTYLYVENKGIRDIETFISLPILGDWNTEVREFQKEIREFFQEIRKNEKAETIERKFFDIREWWIGKVEEEMSAITGFLAIENIWPTANMEYRELERKIMRFFGNFGFNFVSGLIKDVNAVTDELASWEIVGEETAQKEYRRNGKLYTLKNTYFRIPRGKRILKEEHGKFYVLRDPKMDDEIYGEEEIKWLLKKWNESFVKYAKDKI